MSECLSRAQSSLPPPSLGFPGSQFFERHRLMVRYPHEMVFPVVLVGFDPCNWRRHHVTQPVILLLWQIVTKAMPWPSEAQWSRASNQFFLWLTYLTNVPRGLSIQPSGVLKKKLHYLFIAVASVNKQYFFCLAIPDSFVCFSQAKLSVHNKA